MAESKAPNSERPNPRAISFSLDAPALLNGAIPRSPDMIKSHYRSEFEKKLDGVVARVPLVGQIAHATANEEMEYLFQLICEARELFVLGYFYSCIVMCGAVSERILKDICKANLRLKTKTGTTDPNEKFLRCLETVDLSKFLDFCQHGGMISNSVRKDAQEMSQIRNKYAHAKGFEAESDAHKSIQLLGKIVEGTVSPENWEIEKGEFVWQRTALSVNEQMPGEQ